MLTEAFTRRIRSRLGGSPPDSRLAHNSKRCAPARSAAIARSWESTATSKIKPEGIAARVAASMRKKQIPRAHSPSYGSLLFVASENTAAVSPRDAGCVRLLAESAGLIPPFNLRDFSNKETEYEDTQLLFHSQFYCGGNRRCRL